MTTYIDTYVASPGLDALETFLQTFVNFICPAQGSAT